MPDYLLFAAYGLLAIGVTACLVFIAKSFEDEDSEPGRVTIEKHLTIEKKVPPSAASRTAQRQSLSADSQRHASAAAESGRPALQAPTIRSLPHRDRPAPQRSVR
jgi:hypothetical protein